MVLKTFVRKIKANVDIPILTKRPKFMLLTEHVPLHVQDITILSRNPTGNVIGSPICMSGGFDHHGPHQNKQKKNRSFVVVTIGQSR